jgi:hypothetical protein
MPTSLAQALEAQDSLAVALALRREGVLVPMLESEGGNQVRVFREGDADKYMVLLFSSDETYAAMMVDQDVAAERLSEMYTAEKLLDFLKANEGVLETIWFDIAGPATMQASPADIIGALELPRD